MARYHLHAVAMAAVLLSGCSALDPRYINPPRIDNNAARLESQPNAFMQNAGLYIGDLNAASTDIQQGSFAQAWAAAASATETGVEAARRRATGPGQPELATTFTYDPAREQRLAKVFLLRGVAVSDRMCAQWFDRLAKAQAEIRTGQDAVTGIGALTASLAALTGGATAVTGAIAAGTGFGSGLLGSLDSNFVVAPDVGIIQQLITAQRHNAANSFVAADYTYDTALATLANYETTCSHQAVKSVVNQSVANSSASVAKDFSGSISQLVLNVMQGYFDSATVKLTVDDVVGLYALLGPKQDKTFIPQLQGHKVTNDKGVPLVSKSATVGSLTNYIRVLAQTNSYSTILDALVAAAKTPATPAALPAGNQTPPVQAPLTPAPK